MLHVYVPPLASEAVAFAVARMCLVKALPTPWVGIAARWGADLNGVPRRIDGLLFNEAAGRLAVASHLDWGLGVPVHAGQWWRVLVKAPTELPSWEPAPALPRVGAEVDGRDAAFAAALDSQLVAAGDVEQYWARARCWRLGPSAPGEGGGRGAWRDPAREAKREAVAQPALRHARRRAGLLRAAPAAYRAWVRLQLLAASLSLGR